MWIVPKNLKLSSAFVVDTLESSEDLSLPGLKLEQSLMWRSKPSLVQTWLRRWKREPWLQHLFGRTLKPSQHTCFEVELTSLLEDTRVSLFQQQESEQVKTTPDTSGRGSDSMWTQLDLLTASSRTSKDTSVLDSEKSSKTWKALVTQRRGEYSARLKSAHRIRENESTLWATPNTMDYLDLRSPEALYRQATTTRKGRKRPANLREQVDSMSVEIYKKANWPTPTAHLAKEGGYPAEYTRNTPSLTAVAMESEGKSHSSGYLNPDWVEWLMGVPTGWTDLGSWETE